MLRHLKLPLFTLAVLILAAPQLQARPLTWEQQLTRMWSTLLQLEDPLGHKRNLLKKKMQDVAQRCHGLIISKSTRPAAFMINFCRKSRGNWRCGQPDDSAHLVEFTRRKPLEVPRNGFRLRPCQGARVLRIGAVSPRDLHTKAGYRTLIPLVRGPKGWFRIPARAVTMKPQLLIVLLKNRNHIRKYVWVVTIRQ